METTTCYHCSAECSVQSPFRAELGGVLRFFCCAGCQAIAQTIHGQGLDVFYTRRIGLVRPESSVADYVPEDILVYDDEALLNRYAPMISESRLDEISKITNIRQTTLRLEKIRCAACVWLNEQHWKRLPGVIDVQINYATQRAIIKFNTAQVKLSEILFAAQQIGYEAWPFDPSKAISMAKAEQKRLLFRLGVALLSMMQVMMYAWPTYMVDGGMTPEQAKLMGWAGWFLTLPVIFYSAGPIFISAWHSLRHVLSTGVIGMDVPVAIALILAFLAGTYNLLQGHGQTYFDSITMFVAFLLLARYIELRARHSAQGGAEALTRQLPAVCEKVLNYPSSNLDIKITPVVKIEIGDVIRVAPGDVIPVDAMMLSERASVSEALLTGESKPAEKKAGDAVYAGSHNLGAPFVINTSAVGHSTRMAGIANLLEEALQTKPFWAGLAEQWASYFVLLLMLVSIGTGVFWQIFGLQDAWVRAVAVLVVSCPCALSLAAPAALAAAQGALAKIGLLVVKGHALEGLANAEVLVIDKTGTLTTGDLKLVDIKLNLNTQLSKWQVLNLAQQLEVGQNHPLSQAIQKSVLDRVENEAFLIPHILDSVSYQVGQGVHAQGYYLGSRQWVGAVCQEEFAHPTGLQDDQSFLVLAGPTGFIAYLIFEDEARSGAYEFVSLIKQLGLKVHLISGDDSTAVKHWANKYQIDYFQGQMLPEDKRIYVQGLQKTQRVLAVGDGINDAPQLAQADVSVAVGRGVPLAQAGADIILIDESLESLALGMVHARFTKRVIAQNLIWAFVYNLAAIPLAAGGFVTPWVAGIGMSISSLLVTLNAWRLREI